MKTERSCFKELYEIALKQKPEQVDAIIWLQGDRYDRAAKVLKLYENNWSKKIIISGNDILVGPGAKRGENNISLLAMKEWLLIRGVKKEDLIVDEGAMNTREQAEHIMVMAKEKSWQSLILVGSSFYQPRAFLTFLKQAEKIKWVGKIINQPVIIAWQRKPAGRDKLARIIFSEEFRKIKKYKKDVASIRRGINYLKKQ